MKRKKTILSIIFASILLLSITIASSADISPDELYAVLPVGGSVNETKDVFVPPLPPKADIVFSFDLTGSMSYIIGTAKSQANTIMNQLNAIPGVEIQFGVMSYMDYPHSYSSCGYSSVYGSPYGDYAYSLDQSITADTTSVAAAINGLVLGSGGDGPQDYTRIFYESYADTNVGWRTGAKKILLNFGDNVPHDCDLNEGVMAGIWTTGCDPGRDEVAETADDLDLQAVLADMATEGVVLLESHTTTNANAHWQYWTGLTGGDVFITSSSTLVDDITTAVTNALEAPVVYGLHLEASPGFESWLASVSPSAQDVDPGETGAHALFDLTIQVPEGTLPGIYEFTVSALDAVGVNYGDQTVTVVVYDPDGGFVTGGGWINSPAGAYTADPALEGKATFGFVAKYKKGATAPDGNTEFQFHAGDLNFHSTSYDWLVVAGNKAQFKGEGTINGEGSYKFMIFADDDTPDTFRIKIWYEVGEIEMVVYDNGSQQPIESGSIIVHNK